MGLFEGKKGLIIGVANEWSIAWKIAKEVMDQGAECGFTHLPDRADDEKKKNYSRVNKTIKKHDNTKFLVSMDVNNDEDIAAAIQKTKDEFGQIDFLVHSVAYAPIEDLKVDTIQTSRAGFKLAMETSCFSLLAVSNAAQGILTDKASVLTLTYFGGEKAVPGYNVMGICKAALDSTVKYLAFDLGAKGIRVNALSAGPVNTMAARAVDSGGMKVLYEAIAPMGRNITPEEVGTSAAFLLSDMASGITGEIMHVDCGYNIMGSPGRAIDKLASAEK